MKNFILLLVLFVPLSNTIGNSLIVTKSTRGTDPCKRNAAGSKYVTDYVYLTIANQQEITDFQFPLRIKAFHSTGRFLGESAEIYAEDFQTIPLNPTLQEVEISIEIHSSMVPYNEIAEICNGDRNGEGTIIIPVTFRVYHNDQELPSDAEIYDDPGLIPGSNVSESAVPVCCPEEVFVSSDTIVYDRPENNQSWNTPYEYPIGNHSHLFSKAQTNQLPDQVSSQFQFENSGKLKISQNPTSVGSKIRIFVPINAPFKVAMYSYAGHKVVSGISLDNSGEIIIDTTNFQPGYYFIMVTKASMNRIAKIVIIQ